MLSREGERMKKRATEKQRAKAKKWRLQQEAALRKRVEREGIEAVQRSMQKTQAGDPNAPEAWLPTELKRGNELGNLDRAKGTGRNVKAMRGITGRAIEST